MTNSYSTIGQPTLAQILDVDINPATLANGNTIVYNSTTGLWNNAVEGGEVPLTFSTGLTRTVNTITSNIITGISGGQTAVGGTGITDILKLKGTTGNGTSGSPAVQIITGNNGATTALTVLNSGNVGIGQTAPSAKLHVVEPSTVSGSAGVFIEKTGVVVSSGNSYGILAQTTGASTTNYGAFFSASGATNNYGLVVSAGNVGIGTTAPLVKLQVEGAVNTTDLVRLQAATGSGASDAGISFYAMTTGANADARNYKAVINNNAHGTFEILQSTTNSNAPSVNVLTILKDQKVGLGLTAPDQKLHLKDTVNGFVGIRLEGSNGSAGSSNFAGADFTIFASSDTQATATDFIGFYNNSTLDSATAGYKMKIYKLGNVVIGDNMSVAVNEKLRIAGDVGVNSPSFAITSANPNVSVATGVATTVYTFPTQGRVIYYEVFVRLDTGANVSNFSAMTTIAISNSASRQMSVVNGALLVLTMSGLDLQVLQNSGGTQNVMTSVRQIFSSSGF